MSTFLDRYRFAKYFHIDMEKTEDIFDYFNRDVPEIIIDIRDDAWQDAYERGWDDAVEEMSWNPPRPNPTAYLGRRKNGE